MMYAYRETVLECKVHPSDDGKRLDVFISDRYPDVSRSQVQKLIEKGRILVNGALKKPHAHVKDGQTIFISLETKKKLELSPQSIPLDIIYEDDDILLINKSAGMVVHPAPGHLDNTIVNALMGYGVELPVADDVVRPGIVHRLDKDTSGCLLVAKNEQSLYLLAKQFENRQIKKIYIAIVSGRVKGDKGEVDLGIGRHPVDRKRMSVNIAGKSAQTTFEVIERFKDVSVLKIGLKTGRTHQIRVHMSHLGHPVIGDMDYGRRHRKDWESLGVKRQMLHAQYLSFLHPKTQEQLSFTAPIPQDMENLLNILRNNPG